MTAPIASGWSGCRMGFAPTGKRRLCTAHTRCRPSRKSRFYELLRNESSRRQVQPLMFVAVEGLVGALVKAVAYSAPGGIA
jgi:hypothetical protein